VSLRGSVRQLPAVVAELRHVGLIVALGLCLTPGPRCLAQLASLTPSVPAAASAAGSFEDTYNELLGLQPVADRVAEVHDLVLQRDVAKFTLQSGKLYLLTPVGGRMVAVVFLGRGRFAFAPTALHPPAPYRPPA